MPKRIKERIQVGTEPDGKPIYKWVDGYTRQEILLNALKLIQSYGGMTVPSQETAPKSPYLNTYIDEWWKLYKEPKLRHTTKTSYRNVIEHHIKPFFKKIRIEDITTSHIQRFYNEHANMAKSTVRIMSVILHQVLDLAVEDRYIARNPAASKRLFISGHIKIRSALDDNWKVRIVYCFHC